MKKKSLSIEEVVRVVIYVRISMARDNQTSTKTQEKEAREYAAQRGWEVIEVCIDDGKSAWSGANRPGLNRAMEMIETKRANILLVWKLDRFARSITHFHELVGRINRAGGLFASVTDHIDGSTTQGQIMMGLVAGFAQMESDIKSERTLAWQRDRIESGMPNGGQRSYGYGRQINGTLPIEPKEAKLLQVAAARILGGESLRSVLRELQPQSVTGNGPMTLRGLRSALTNPTVAGLRRSDDDYAPGNWDAILARETWDALNALFSNPDRRTAPSNQLSHLLSGIIECDRCGKTVGIRKWKANPTNRQPYTQESHRYTCLCGNSIDERNAESVVMKSLWEIVTPEVWREWQSTGRGWDQSVIDDIASRRDAVTMQFLTPTKNGRARMTQGQYDRYMEMLDREESIALGDEPLDLPRCESLSDSWEDLPILDKRKVIRHAFETIILRAANGTRDPYKRIEVA